MKDVWGDKKPSAPTTSGSMDAWPSKANPGTRMTGAPAESASKAALPGATRQIAGGTTKDDYWNAREQRDLEKDRIYREEDIPAMRRSTAYKVAGQVLSAAVAAEAVTFGSAAKGKRLDMFLAMLDLIAAHVEARVNGEEIVPDGEEVTDSAEPAQEEADLG